MPPRPQPLEPPPAPSAARRGAALPLLGLLLAAVLVAYSNSFPGAFYFDDDDAILQNTSIRRLSDLGSVLTPPTKAGIGGRPFANLTFALNHAAGQYDPWGYHAANLGIHLAATCLLFGVTRRTLLLPSLRPRFGQAATLLAGLVAAVWGLHPLAGNVVNYMSQRTEGLAAALYLATLYAFVRGVQERTGAWTAVAILAGALGMATKEIVVTMPAVVLLYDRTFVAGTFIAALRQRWRSHLLLASTWLLLAYLMHTSKLDDRGVGFSLGPTVGEYVLTSWRSVVLYLKVALWPHPLIFDYGPSFIRSLREAWPWGASLCALLCATAVAVWRWPRAGFGPAWFFVLLAPTSSVIPIVQQPYAENRVYLPLAGVAAAGIVAAYHALGRRAVLALAAAPVALGLMTHARNPAFRSEIAIWWETTVKRPENERGWNNLGNAYLKVDRFEDALAPLDRAIEIKPTYADPHNNRGVVMLRLRRPEEALAEFKRAAELKSGYADAYYNMGEAYLQMGRPADAIGVLETSLQMKPNNPKAYNNLGIALLDTGRVRESVAAERRSIALDPNLPEPHYNLGNSLWRAGDTTAALAEYDRALQLDPTFARAHNNAGVLLLRAGRREEAAVRFEAALRIDPGYETARKNLEAARPK